ncbi:ead/Ea22-like family protein [Cronobacter dublinensis]
MSDINELTAKLKAAAECASGGEWVKESGDGWEAVCSADDQANGGFIIAALQGPDARANREFIQAANPAAVLELIAALEAAEKRTVRLPAEDIGAAKEFYEDAVVVPLSVVKEVCAASGINLEAVG